jgi:hypothetical protein
MPRPPVVIPATAPVQEHYSHVARLPVVVPAGIDVMRPPIMIPATVQIQQPHTDMSPPLQVSAVIRPIENILQPRANDQWLSSDSDRDLVLNRTGMLPAKPSV